MPSPLSVDLRERVVAAVTEGASFHHCRALRNQRVQCQPLVGALRAGRACRAQAVRRRPCLAAHQSPCGLDPDHLPGRAADLPARVARPAGRARCPDQHEQLVALLCPPRHHPQKGATHAAEREDVREAREAWFEAQPDLDPDRLVFLDETAAATNMARRYGRAPRGERCRIAVPQGHYKTTTVTAALRSTGLVATALLDEATNGQRFRSYVTETLVPVLKRGNTVILDNLPAHKVAGVRQAVEAAGARLLSLPPCSPDFTHRAGVCQAQGAAALSGRSHRSGSARDHPASLLPLHAQGVPQLPRRCWIRERLGRCYMNRRRSSVWSGLM